jgi:cell cycle arrest protein BUB2
MAHLDLFLQRGPQNGDVEASLEELRRIVLTDGIPANIDGTVSSSMILVYLCSHH